MSFLPRIHVLLARDAPIGVVIRRGPSKYVCTVRWDREHDTFAVGQWLKGRIYERRCDLSPDGRYMIYFAMNGKWETETQGAWTAVSRTPYLKAIGLWAKGDCWNGGGLFVDDTTFWLNAGPGHQELSKPPNLRITNHYPGIDTEAGECPLVYYPRLQRDGWRLVSEGRDLTVFEKPIGSGWALQKLAHSTMDHPVGKGCYYDEHQLMHLPTSQKIQCPTWEWADLDRNRLVWAESGRLYAGRVTNDGLDDATELYDFNGMTFEPIQAPY